MVSKLTKTRFSGNGQKETELFGEVVNETTGTIREPYSVFCKM